METEKLIEMLIKYQQTFEAYQNPQFERDMEAAADTITALQSELAKVKAERDAAVDDLRNLACQQCTCYACENDKFDYDKSCCIGCQYNNWDNWQWRGVQEGEQDVIYRKKFCPNCGAKMDLEVQEVGANIV